MKKYFFTKPLLVKFLTINKIRVIPSFLTKDGLITPVDISRKTY